VLAWQGWMTLCLFDAERTPARLLDDRPVVSGRHPLHLYHGYLGAQALHRRGSLSCYDPAFHAGYPKTPVFDGGSRPAELTLALAGGRYDPASYKIGLAAFCVLAPALLWLAARGAGLSRLGALLTAALGALVWWGRPCREALEAGDVDLLLATVAAVALAGLLLRFHRRPGPLGLLGVMATAFLGWFAHPLLLALLFPLFLIYYVSVGTRHRLTWHVALLGGLLAAVGANGFWLPDWVEYWWIRAPAALDTSLAADWSARALWAAPLWGGPVDRALAAGLVGTATVGAVLFNQRGQRAAARLFGLGVIGFLALAVTGTAWEAMGRLGTTQLLVPALLFAAPAAAHGLTEWLLLLKRRAGGWWGWLALGAGAAVAAGWPGTLTPLPGWAAPWQRAEPLAIGLGPVRSALVEQVRTHTTAQARILWEDRVGGRLGSRWTALLPLLTDRAFVGGLDAEAGIEHTAAGLTDRGLAGKALAEVRDDDLAQFCARYNVGWVVCWSPAVVDRLRSWSGAEYTAAVPDDRGGPDGCLFTVRRRHSFVLVGSAQWLKADARQIVLGDVVPRKAQGHGEVVLSLHHQAGLRVTPSRVRLVEPSPNPNDQDAIPFIRLQVDEPVARVTLTWDKR
jgi:hypothetical protein